MLSKIVIIGAGPVGCFTAQLLKKHGFEPVLIEEHSEIGRPVHCTGLVGSRLFLSKNSYPVPSSAIINVVNGAVIHLDGVEFTIKRPNVAYVVDREKFDKELGNGLDVLFQNKFLGIEKSKNGYTIETDKNELYADIVIGADGANSVLRRYLNPDCQIKCYRGVQLRLKTKVKHSDLVEVYLKKPSFFWIVPERNDVVRIGTISENPFEELKVFMNDLKIKGEVLERFGGLVATGICETTVKDNIALVGDAACQVKPMTYGGIYFGLEAAKILAQSISDNRLRDYDELWKRNFSSEIKIGLRIRSIYNNLEAAEIKKIFNIMKKNKILIEKFGDFENHSRLILEIIKKPRLYPYLGELVTMLFNKII